MNQSLSFADYRYFLLGSPYNLHVLEKSTMCSIVTAKWQEKDIIGLCSD